MKVMDKSHEIFNYENRSKEQDKVKKEFSETCPQSDVVRPIDNQYKVTIHTGKQRGAGTDADVSITLYGAYTNSGSIMLNAKKSQFENGRYDCHLTENVRDRFFFFSL